MQDTNNFAYMSNKCFILKIQGGMIMKKLLIVATILILFTGCVVKATPYHAHLESNGYLQSNDKPGTISTDVTQSLIQMSQIMIDEFKKENDNVFVSAPSLYLALAMTMQGAQNETLEEMKKALQVDGLTMDDLNENLKSLQLSMLQKEGIDMRLTNSIWIRDTFEERVLQSFIDVNKKYYAPMIASGDFNDQKMVDGINDWVSNATNKKIKTAIDEPIHPLTRMFLINTLYFKGDWSKPFEKFDTAKRPFLDKEVDMMAIIDSFQYTENDLGQFIALPYKDSDVIMVVALAKDNQEVTIKDLVDASKNMNPEEIDFQLPKVQSELTLSAKDFLITQGMNRAFDGSLADFDAMAQDATKTGLHIASITQKTFLAIDEKGTEAAAMTKVEMRDESMPISNVIMHVNRPFTLMIYDPTFEVVYFAGYISNPEGSK